MGLKGLTVEVKGLNSIELPIFKKIKHITKGSNIRIFNEFKI